VKRAMCFMKPTLVSRGVVTALVRAYHAQRGSVKGAAQTVLSKPWRRLRCRRRHINSSGRCRSSRQRVTTSWRPLLEIARRSWSVLRRPHLLLIRYAVSHEVSHRS
jgi:hypothetical protein